MLDAERRDLTINAMSMDLDGNLYDYFHGAEDLLQERCVKIGNICTVIGSRSDSDRMSDGL